MIELKGFGQYSLNLETNEVFSVRAGELVRIEPCKDSNGKCWYLYKNGQKFRKTIWKLLDENKEKIEKYIKEKSSHNHAQ